MIGVSQKNETVLELNNSRVYIDRSQKILSVKWYGLVDLPIAQEILMTASNYIEDGSANRILLDRQNLIEFSSEARTWIKDDLLKNRAKKLVHQVEKVATVQSTSTMGNLFSTVVSTAIRIVFPGLRMKSFKQSTDARAWLEED